MTDAAALAASYLVPVSRWFATLPARYPAAPRQFTQISYEGNRVRRRASGSTNHTAANRQTVKTVMIVTMKPGST